MIENRIRAVAFDLDGLMVNTEDLYDEVMTILLARRDRLFDRAVKLEMMGRTAEAAFSILRTRCQLIFSRPRRHPLPW